MTRAIRVSSEEKLTVPCPACRAKAGKPCETANGVPWEIYPSRRRLRFHKERRTEYLRAIEQDDNDEEP